MAQVRWNRRGLEPVHWLMVSVILLFFRGDIICCQLKYCIYDPNIFCVLQAYSKSGVVQSAQRLAKGWTLWGWYPEGREVFLIRPDRPESPPITKDTGSFPGVKRPDHGSLYLTLLTPLCLSHTVVFTFTNIIFNQNFYRRMSVLLPLLMSVALACPMSNDHEFWFSEREWYIGNDFIGAPGVLVVL